MNDRLKTSKPPQIIPLYPGGAPGSDDWNQPESETVLPNGLRVVRNVSQPTLTVFRPATPNSTAVIVCPGGAYHFLAFDHEGIRVAEWLNARGITAFMLKYRVLQTGDDFPECIGKHLQDAAFMDELALSLFPMAITDTQQAVRIVRARAAEWGVDPGKIGVMGFSAGGMVTVSVARQYDPDSRPDFAAPIYSAPPPSSPIPSDAPPIFLLCAADDQMATEVSPRLFSEWLSAGRQAELHIYASGGHGFGMNPQRLPVDAWIERFWEWLHGIGCV